MTTEDFLLAFWSCLEIKGRGGGRGGPGGREGGRGEKVQRKPR